MTRYPLQSALDLRQREEEAANTILANATRSLRVAEAEEARLEKLVSGAWERLQAARQDSSQLQPNYHAGATVGQALFEERRRGELKRAETALTEFRHGALAAAQTGERTARAGVSLARRRREALEKHAAKHAAASRLAAERVAEETLEELARAARHAQPKRHG